jgi:Putative zinc-finger
VVMGHDEAMRREAVEKYLMDEMSPPERDEFEAHFFDCRECAEDLRATAAFLDEAKREFERGAAPRPKPEVAKGSRFGSRLSFLWKPAFAAPAFALLLAVIVYQNVAVHPRLAGEVVRVDQPEVLSTVSLIGAGSRGGDIPSVTITGSQPVLLTVDIPATEQYASYSCALIAPGGGLLWRVPVSAEQAKDTVSIRVPAGRRERGLYTLLVQGYVDPAQGKAAEVARYRFAMTNIN